MKALIFNSGLGSRMGSLTKERPKCLVELYNGETILERQIRILSECGIQDFIITTGPYAEQIVKATARFPKLHFVFVENPDYKNTNYIVSMYYAYEYLDDDMLLLHGDLVFNRNLVENMLRDERASLCLFHGKKELPEKDFKGRFCGNVLKEVSVSIFDKDCFAFQPMYKLGKREIQVWKEKAAELVRKGEVSVYAENALNQVTDEISLYGMSYEGDYIEEIDNEEDYVRVSDEIRFFDCREQRIVDSCSYIQALKKLLHREDAVFVVSGKSFAARAAHDLEGYPVTVFSNFSPNPKFEEIKEGAELFKQKSYGTIVSIGGGSAIDTAKCIKMLSAVEQEADFLEKKYVYSHVKHIAIPTTAGTGSESTQFAVMYVQGKKISVEHGSLLPDTAVLDASLLKSLPAYPKKAALLDSLCQAIESYWSKGATEESRGYAKQCMALILEHYEEYFANGESGCKAILTASNFSGKAIQLTKTTAAHAMSYQLTTRYGISHGHAVALCIIPIWRLLHRKAQTDDKLRVVLTELAEGLGSRTIEDSICKVDRIIKSFQLPGIQISSEELPELSAGVDLARMNNTPAVLTRKEIEGVYGEIGRSYSNNTSP